MDKDIESILFSEEQLQECVARVAGEITRDFQGREPVFVCVLKGSFVFFADLVRRVELKSRVDFIAASSYGGGSTTTGNVKITKDLSTNVEGRDVIVVEDIIDSGLTLSFLKNFLQQKNPASVSLVTLLDKPERRRVELKPDYVGFQIPDKFVVGYGLDYAEQYRYLPYVGILKPSVYE